MRAATKRDINWEVEAVLAWHDENAKAAIATLLEDIYHLREQLVLADQALSRGLTRGWRPIFAPDVNQPAPPTSADLKAG